MSLVGRVCLVTGATRGIGKGIAAMLSKAGATVYITGRSVSQELEAELSSFGGECIAIQCDHGIDSQVGEVFERIKSEQNGKLDVLVNNAFAGVSLKLHVKNVKSHPVHGESLAVITDYAGTKFYEQPYTIWDTINNVGTRSNYVAAHFAANMMIPNKRGLIVNISSPGGLRYLFNIAYGVGKQANDRMMADIAVELRKHNIAAVSLWPGPVLTETIKGHLAGEEGELAAKNAIKLFEYNAEDPTFAGKAVVALACDNNVMKKSGCIVLTTELAREYGFTDIGGKQPLSIRQLKYLVHYFSPKLEWLVPEFLYVPWWMIAAWNHKFWSSGRSTSSPASKL